MSSHDHKEGEEVSDTNNIQPQQEEKETPPKKTWAHLLELHGIISRHLSDEN